MINRLSMIKYTQPMFLTKHFQLEYTPNSLAEKEKDEISKTLESSYQKVIQSLELKDSFPLIKYFLYESNEDKGKAMGDDGNGNAIWDKFEIHGIYNKEIQVIGPHEITHLLTLNLGMPPEIFRQGVAEAMESGWAGRPHEYWLKQFIKDKKYVSLSELLDDKKFFSFDESISYPESGAFIKYFLKKYGLAVFKILYKELERNGDSDENIKKFEGIVGDDLTRIEKSWLSSVKK